LITRYVGGFLYLPRLGVFIALKSIKSKNMEYLRLLVKINNIVGYVLIATIILCPIGFIQVLLGHLVLIEMGEKGWSGRGDKLKDII